MLSQVSKRLSQHLEDDLLLLTASGGEEAVAEESSSYAEAAEVADSPYAVPGYQQQTSRETNQDIIKHVRQACSGH